MNPGMIGLTRQKVALYFFSRFLEYRLDVVRETREKLKMPLFGELSRSSQDSFESESDSKESWDDRLNSPKIGIFNFLRFLGARRRFGD